MMTWNGYDSNIPFLLRRVSKKLEANWQAPKHSSYLWQTEQARKLDTVVSFPLEFDHDRKRAASRLRLKKALHMIMASERRSLNECPLVI